jgi:hypothetical protein
MTEIKARAKTKAGEGVNPLGMRERKEGKGKNGRMRGSFRCASG